MHLAYWLHLQAWRYDREHPHACYYYARVTLHRRGPLEAWKILRRYGDLPDATPKLRAEWMAFSGYVTGLLRDFDIAERWLERAEELDAGNPWICIERAGVLEQEDRYPDALRAAQMALEIHPWYRPAVQSVAHMLQLLDRDGEAMELLEEANRRIESGPVAAQLTAAQMESQDYDGAAQSLDRFVELSPLLEKAESSWLAITRSEIAYHRRRLASAIELLKDVDDPFHAKISENLQAAPPDATRVLISIPFVRQHHVTCAPATLSAISRYWKQPADHLEVAEEICYDGTPDYSERHWATSNGWDVREFTVTWDAARMLLDRGVTFTLTTVNTGSAHLQAVIGYDARRGTFLIRDPYYRPVSEMLFEGLLEAHQSTGPRGMVLVPVAQSHLLDGIELPEAAHYDLLHSVNRALQEHDRDAASAAHQEMCALAPEHRLTWQARRALASYDSDSAELLACADALLQQFPDDANLRLARLSYSHGFESRDERLRRLREIAEGENTDPLFWQQYAQELDDDAREHATALRWINRSLRARPLEAGSLYILGNILWGQGKREEALQWYRFAASLSERDEHLSRSYFSASCHFKQADEVLHFLCSRFERFGKRSGQPARTLFWALNQVDRTEEAFRVLEDALQLRPDDGDLLLFAAGAQGRYSRMERAAELLQIARGKVAHTAWLRVAATLASYRGELKDSLAQWQRVLEAEPLSIDAHENVVRLLAETEHRDAWIVSLNHALERFPHHYALRRLQVEYLREHFRDSSDFTRLR
jgi:tetratricopeptide (TPR) repeat protein